MSYGLFEHLAHTEQSDGVERRKAIALARARTSRKFARFVGQDPQRLALVAGEVAETVRQACAEVGYTDWEGIHDAITASFGQVHESVRKPKTCPYHREVMDISLAAGDPAAGFNAMAQHAYTDQSCRGSWEGGRCNFKAEMATQDYWDKKAEKAQERREERERAQQEQLQAEAPPLIEDDPVIEPATTPETEPEFASDYEDASEFRNVPSTERDLEPAMASRHAEYDPQVGRERLMDHDASRCPACKAPWTRASAQREQCEHCGANPYQHVPAEMGYPQFQSRTAEALKTIDVEGKEGPVPTIDKSKWNPANMKAPDAEMSGTPHPTREQDIIQRPDYGSGKPFADDGRLDQTRAVTETQDVTEGIEELSQPGGSQWTGQGGQASPVTSSWVIANVVAADDPDKNPLLDDDEEDNEDEE